MSIRRPQLPFTPGNRRGWQRLALRWLLLLLLLFGGLSYVVVMPGSSHRGPLEPLSASAGELQGRLQEHVLQLATRIGERSIRRVEGLEAAARYIRGYLERSGYAVATQPVPVQGLSVSNLETQIQGGALGDEILLVGAHYDSVHGSPGANDNASGVAALLELARMTAARRFARTVRFVAFVNEEPPFFQTSTMGSVAYAKRARARGENIVAMLSLETLGYYTREPGSQRYPFPFRYFYPDRGDFIGFVGNLSSRHLVRRAISSFRRNAAFPSEGVAAPAWITGIGWSDHASFWTEGYAAIMITDTAPFRYEHYHAATDTPDKLDFGHLARVVEGLGHVVQDLASDG
ncbi:MAG: M28 family peptidase [Gammaproteobacteria bacterium]|nr:M28 family peptidase [Gammaproteobacteria bacterium]